LVIEPGTAIDCCGRELIVHLEEPVDLLQFEEVRKLQDEQEAVNHTLQIRICYRECPTEDIPVLYDECGCQDTRCAPNRVLESFEAKGEVVPDPAQTALPPPGLRGASTMGVAGAAHVALDETRRVAYVLTDADPASLFVVRTDNHAVKACRNLDA